MGGCAVHADRFDGDTGVGADQQFTLKGRDRQMSAAPASDDSTPWRLFHRNRFRRLATVWAARKMNGLAFTVDGIIIGNKATSSSIATFSQTSARYRPAVVLVGTRAGHCFGVGKS